MEKFDIKKIKAIIGLGNPGEKYYKNRHSIGFRIIDELANSLSADWDEKDKFLQAKIFINSNENTLNSQSIYLIKPLTFMNNSGHVLSFLIKKGIKAEEILVVHDELEKNFGDIKIKFGGSAKGHNGLRSIISVIGSNFWRLCFGIGRPEEKSQVSNFVLSNFNLEQEEELPNLILKSVEMILQK